MEEEEGGGSPRRTRPSPSPASCGGTRRRTASCCCRRRRGGWVGARRGLIGWIWCRRSLHARVLASFIACSSHHEPPLSLGHSRPGSGNRLLPSLPQDVFMELFGLLDPGDCARCLRCVRDVCRSYTWRHRHPPTQHTHTPTQTNYKTGHAARGPNAQGTLPSGHASSSSASTSRPPTAPRSRPCRRRRRHGRGRGEGGCFTSRRSWRRWPSSSHPHRGATTPRRRL